MSDRFRLELDAALTRANSFIDRGSDFRKAVCALPDTPILPVIGSGCSYGVAALVAQFIQEDCGRVALPVTPLQAMVTMPRAKAAVMITSGGDHPQNLAVVRHLQNLESVILVTNRQQSAVARELDGLGRRVTTILSKWPPADGGFIPVEKCLAQLGATMGLVLSETLERAEKLQKATREQCERHQAALRTTLLVGILHAFYQLPAAQDLAGRLNETVALIPQLSDAWEFAHGRYLAVAAGRPGLVVSMCGSDTEQILGPIIRAISPDVPVIQIRSVHGGVRSSMDCYVQSLEFIACIADAKNVDVTNPPEISWGKRLYERSVTPW